MSTIETATDKLLTGTVIIYNAGGGVVYILCNEDNQTYFVPAVQFPKIPGSDFRGVQVGSQVTFRPFQGPNGLQADVVEAHIGATYSLFHKEPSEYCPPTVYSRDGRTAVHVKCTGQDWWHATDIDGQSYLFSVWCEGKFKAYKLDRTFDFVNVSDCIRDELRTDGVVLFLDASDKLAYSEADIATTHGVQVPAGTYVLFAEKNGQVTIHRLSRRSVWEGEGRPPKNDTAKRSPGWSHWLVIELNRVSVKLDPKLLMSGNISAIAEALPKSGLGLARDNDGFAEAIAEAGSYLQD